MHAARADRNRGKIEASSKAHWKINTRTVLLLPVWQPTRRPAQPEFSDLPVNHIYCECFLSQREACSLIFTRTQAATNIHAVIGAGPHLRPSHRQRPDTLHRHSSLVALSAVGNEISRALTLTLTLTLLAPEGVTKQLKPDRGRVHRPLPTNFGCLSLSSSSRARRHQRAISRPPVVATALARFLRGQESCNLQPATCCALALPRCQRETDSPASQYHA